MDQNRVNMRKRKGKDRGLEDERDTNRPTGNTDNIV